MKRQHQRCPTIPIVLISALAFLAGCSLGGEHATAPSVQQMAYSTLPIVSKTIGPEGGTIIVADEPGGLSGAYAGIPQGALAASTNITISRAVGDMAINGDTSALFIAFEPAATAFAKPVTIGLPCCHGLQDPAIYQFNDITQAWLQLENIAVDHENSAVLGKATHFSLFCAWDKKDIFDVDLFRSAENVVASIVCTESFNQIPAARIGPSEKFPGISTVYDFFSAYPDGFYVAYTATLKEIWPGEDRPLQEVTIAYQVHSYYAGGPYALMALVLNGPSFSPPHKSRDFIVKYVTGSDSAYFPEEEILDQFKGKPIFFYFENIAIDPEAEYYVTVRRSIREFSPSEEYSFTASWVDSGNIEYSYQQLAQTGEDLPRITDEGDNWIHDAYDTPAGAGCLTTADCDDSNICTYDTCLAGTCINTNNTLQCSDGDPCTTNDVCAGGACSGAPLDADADGYVSAACDGNDCDDHNFNINPGAAEGPAGSLSCSDGLDNNCDEYIDALDPACEPEPECTVPRDCNDDNPCTDDTCTESECVYTANTNLCNDGDPCTMNDTCARGTCSGAPLDADADGYVSAACEGTDCDDNNININPKATEGPAGYPSCSDGWDNDCDGSADDQDDNCYLEVECTAANDCNDDNPCTDNLCLSGMCIYTDNTSPCNDGVRCTMNDTCAGGTCSGVPLDDDDDGYVSAACRGDDCDDSNYNIHPGVTEGAPGDSVCSDGRDNDCDEFTDERDPGCIADLTVNFPDPRLEAALRDALEKPTGELKAADLAFLTEFMPHVEDITDISGIEYCINLKYLNLDFNRISELGPLAGLVDLQELSLQVNLLISDISPLAGLVNLQELDLDYDQISDISPLAGLVNLQWLYLENNQISEVNPLVQNGGINSGDEVYLEDNPLNTNSCTLYVPELESRGVTVYSDCP